MGPECYIASVGLFAGTFAPKNWADCDGAVLQIRQNTALFSLIGTTYGGDGRRPCRGQAGALRRRLPQLHLRERDLPRAALTPGVQVPQKVASTRSSGCGGRV